MSREWLSTDLWRAHLSWSTPKWIGQTEEGRKSFDAVQWVETLRIAKYNSLIFYCKFHDGFCTFPSKYSATGMPERDFFGETSREAKKYGMKVMAYYSATLDYELAQQHEDWRVIGRDGRASHAGMGFIVPSSYLCINNPGYRRLMLDQIQEIVNYEPDGIWFDGYAPIAYDTNKNTGDNCFCPHCRKKYTSETGGDIFDTDSNAWYKKCYIDFLHEMNSIIKAGNPDRVFTINQGRMPECNEVMDFYTAESHCAELASVISRSMRDGRKPFEVTYRMQTLPLSWSMKSAEVIKLESAAIIAHGGACSIEFSPTHTAYFQKDAINTLEKVGAYVRSVEKYCVNTEPVYDVAYMMPGNYRGVRWYWDSVLTERDVPYDFVYKNSDLSKYQLVITDPHIALDIEMADKLNDYVRNGGNLIVECNTGIRGDETYSKMLNILGLKSAGKAAGNIRYISNIDKTVAEGMGQDPLIVENVRAPLLGGGAVSEFDAPYYTVTTGSATPLAFFNYAFADWALGKNIWYRLSPAIKCSGEPAVTVNKYGDGRAMFIACPLVFSELNGHKKPDAIDRRVYCLQFAANLARYMLDEPLLKDSTPAGVEIIVNKQDKKLIVHILNHYCESTYFESRNELLRLADITLYINSNRIGAVSRVFSAGDGKTPKEIPFERDGKWIKVVIQVLKTNEILILE